MPDMLKTKHDVLKKTYQVHYTGCPFISICIIPKILYIRFFHKTTKDIVVYLVFPGGRKIKKCCHYDKKSTLEWVTGWDVTTEELICTVCGAVIEIRDKEV